MKYFIHIDLGDLAPKREDVQDHVAKYIHLKLMTNADAWGGKEGQEIRCEITAIPHEDLLAFVRGLPHDPSQATDDY